MLQPGTQDATIRTPMTPESWLVAQGRLRAQNPDNTEPAERAALVRKFYEEADRSHKRQEALKYWKEADRLTKGMHWTEVLKESDYRSNYQFVINEVYSIKEKVVSLLVEGLPEIEFLERNPNHTEISNGIDNFFRHEWERNNWYMTLVMAIDEAVKHRVGFIKCYWDVHEDGGRGSVVLEAVSNYDLFIHERAIIKDGKLIAKYIIHRMDKSRNEIIAQYKVDPTGEFQSAKGFSRFRGSKDRPFLDSVRNETHQRTGGSDMQSRPPGYQEMEENFLLRECHYRDDALKKQPGINDTSTQALRYPTGRVITECNGHVLWDEENMAGFCMFIPVTVEPDIKEIHGPSLINQLSGMQMAVNKSFSQIFEHTERCANPTRRISLSAMNANQDTDLSRPGATVIVMDDHEQGFSYAEAPPLGGEVVQVLTISMESMENTSGVYEVSQGEATARAPSGIAIEKLQTAARTRSNLRMSFLDQSLKEIARCISSLFLDFVSEDRQFRFLDEESQAELHGVFNAAALVFPSRMERARELQEQMNLEKQKIVAASRQLPPDQLIEYENYQLDVIAELDRMIDQVFAMPAHDLVSLDVRIQTGTRSMTRAIRQSNAMILYELDVIDDATLLKHLEFPNAHKIIQAKAEERKALAEAQQAAMEAQQEQEKEHIELEHDNAMELAELKSKMELLEEKVRGKAVVDAAKIRADKPESDKED